MSGGLSTTDVLQAIRARLLNTPDANGNVLSTTLGDRLYIVDVPSDATYPFGVMRLQGDTSGGWQMGIRLTPDCELLLYGRPFSSRATIEAAADLADGAMLLYQDRSGGGVIACNNRKRDSVRGTPPEAADRELVVVRCVYSLIVYPKYLTAHPTT